MQRHQLLAAERVEEQVQGRGHRGRLGIQNGVGPHGGAGRGHQGGRPHPAAHHVTEHHGDPVAGQRQQLGPVTTDLDPVAGRVTGARVGPGQHRHGTGLQGSLQDRRDIALLLEQPGPADRERGGIGKGGQEQPGRGVQAVGVPQRHADHAERDAGTDQRQQHRGRRCAVRQHRRAHHRPTGAEHATHVSLTERFGPADEAHVELLPPGHHGKHRSPRVGQPGGRRQHRGEHLREGHRLRVRRTGALERLAALGRPSCVGDVRGGAQPLDELPVPAYGRGLGGDDPPATLGRPDPVVEVLVAAPRDAAQPVGADPVVVVGVHVLQPTPAEHRRRSGDPAPRRHVGVELAGRVGCPDVHADRLDQAAVAQLGQRDGLRRGPSGGEQLGPFKGQRALPGEGEQRDALLRRARARLVERQPEHAEQPVVRQQRQHDPGLLTGRLDVAAHRRVVPVGVELGAVGEEHRPAGPSHLRRGHGVVERADLDAGQPTARPHVAELAKLLVEQGDARIDRTEQAVTGGHDQRQDLLDPDGPRQGGPEHQQRAGSVGCHVGPLRLRLRLLPVGQLGGDIDGDDDDPGDLIVVVAQRGPADVEATHHRLAVGPHPGDLRACSVPGLAGLDDVSEQIADALPGQLGKGSPDRDAKLSRAEQLGEARVGVGQLQPRSVEDPHDRRGVVEHLAQ